jgi:hypothetical protein
MRAKEFITEYDAFNEGIEDSFTGYRGVGVAELKEILKTGHALPSTDLMPFDNEIIEYSIGEESFEAMSDRDIEEWVRDTVPWYNGSLQSVKGGVNFTTDEFNAEGYGDYLLGLKINGPYVDFSDIHSFAKNYKDVEVVAYKKHGTDDWIEVKKNMSENKTHPGWGKSL